jgi:hypothetical protein
MSTRPKSRSWKSGSPPRVWGRCHRRRPLFLVVRFTPTRVGTMEISDGFVTGVAVHPHACGDDASSLRRLLRCSRFTPTRVGTIVTTISVACAIAGSPPRVWGRSTRRPYREVDSPVHPHACGDDWGTLLECSSNVRFTPTRVGTINDATQIAGARHGSPPRVWGRCTGRQTRPFPPAVHPHACGDDDENSIQTHQVYGSPPRVWGRCVVVILTRKAVLVHPHACGDDTRILPCVLLYAAQSFLSRAGPSSSAVNGMRTNCKPSRFTTARLVSPAIRI